MMKTSELTGEKLREWVARAQGWKIQIDVDSLICFDEADTVHSFGEFGYCPDKNWAQGGPIIERERIDISAPDEFSDDERWFAGMWQGKSLQHMGMKHEARGETPLTAAMRCYVSSKYGETVPDALG